MKNFPIFLVVVLLGLLVLLATLQYRWLGQISDGEREHLQKVAQSDTQHFAEDFDREMQNAYFNFQLNADDWRKKNWSAFDERWQFYLQKTAYPNLIKNFYFVKTGDEQHLARYNRATKAFESVGWTETLERLKPRLADENNFQPMAADFPALLLPVREENASLTKILVRTRTSASATEKTENSTAFDVPKRFGVLIVELDRSVIENEIFPALIKKYFSENESANFRLSIVDDQARAIFQTGEVTSVDASAKIFSLSPDNFIFYANRDLLPPSDGTQTNRKTMVFSRVESRSVESNSTSGERRVEMNIASGEMPRVRIFDGQTPPTGAGAWTLNVQHTAGSLEQFITRTRRQNLAISFGILSLLAVSVVLIFWSAQRAKLFARRQIDFVSSVSHEFRTPLAVIYSAGENLADGVASEKAQIARYGNLIKGEGRKLSKMVEQILDFAGANAGKRKLDLRAESVGEIIENAIGECQSLLDGKSFAVEQNIAENLPSVFADKTALSQAIQNLIANAVKYSNGEKRLKISASNGNKQIKILVEDYGIGIAPKDLKHIFEPFYRAKSVVDEQIHGSGLGLSLVKQIVEAHNGAVEAESEIGKGSKFTITLTT